MANGRSFSEVSEDSIDPDDALSVHPCLPGLSAKLVSSSSLTGAARDGKPVKQRRKASLFTNFMKAEREMRNVEEEPEIQVRPETNIDSVRLSQLLAKLVGQIGQLQSQIDSARDPAPRQRLREQRKPECWDGGQLGHNRKDCPTHLWTATKNSRPSGNYHRPQ